jgi:hypothetical protein
VTGESYLRAYIFEHPAAHHPEQGRIFKFQINNYYYYLSSEEMAYANRLADVDNWLFCCGVCSRALLLRYRMKTKPGSVMFLGKPSP